MADRSEARRRLAEIAARQAEQVSEARARLETEGPVRLSDLGELDPRAFDLFLRLLGDALATWRPRMMRTTATSGDGSMEIRLTALDDGTTAEVHTPHGVFSGPDHLVEIVVAGTAGVGDAVVAGVGTEDGDSSVEKPGGAPASAGPALGADDPEPAPDRSGAQPARTELPSQGGPPSAPPAAPGFRDTPAAPDTEGVR